MEKKKSLTTEEYTARWFFIVACFFILLADIYIKFWDPMGSFYSDPFSFVSGFYNLYDDGLISPFGFLISYFILTPLSLFTVTALLFLLPRTSRNLNCYALIFMFAGSAEGFFATDWDTPLEVFAVTLIGIAILAVFGSILLSQSLAKRRIFTVYRGKTKRQLLREYENYVACGIMSPPQLEEYRRILDAADPDQRYY